MPIVCYQVEDFEVEPGNVLVVRTYSRAVPNTNLEELLRLVAPSLRPLDMTPDFFIPGYRFQLSSADVGAAQELCAAHAAPVVTAMSACQVSVCLDWHAHPDDGFPPKWHRTEMGTLVYRAKYRGLEARRQAGPILAQRVIDYVDRHPVLRQVRRIAAIPSSQVTGPAKPGLVRGVASLLARHLGAQLVDLERVTETPLTQKSLTRDDDPEANQAGTMACELDDTGPVLLIDDLMRHGSTVNEAARALSAAGVDDVYSLNLVKERTGTKGYAFP